jgi:hypothetical protein
MTPRWIHAAFCLIWLATAGVFAELAHDSYESTNTKLERFYRTFPHDAQIALNGINYARVMSDMADANNRNVNELEDSIRRSGKVQMRLNIFSAFMSVVGLVAQIGAFLHENRKHHQRTGQNQ